LALIQREEHRRTEIKEQKLIDFKPPPKKIWFLIPIPIFLKIKEIILPLCLSK
jgi:hypothetical protein